MSVFQLTCIIKDKKVDSKKLHTFFCNMVKPRYTILTPLFVTLGIHGVQAGVIIVLLSMNTDTRCYDAIVKSA